MSLCHIAIYVLIESSWNESTDSLETKPGFTRTAKLRAFVSFLDDCYRRPKAIERRYDSRFHREKGPIVTTNIRREYIYDYDKGRCTQVHRTCRYSRFDDPAWTIFRRMKIDDAEESHQGIRRSENKRSEEAAEKYLICNRKLGKNWWKLK